MDRDAAQLAHFRGLRLNSVDAGIEMHVLRAQAENLSGPQAWTDASEEALGKKRHQPAAFEALDVFHRDADVDELEAELPVRDRGIPILGGARVVPSGPSWGRERRFVRKRKPTFAEPTAGSLRRIVAPTAR